MAFSKVIVLFSRQQIIAAAAIFIILGAAVESLVPPFSFSQEQRHRQFPSSSLVESPASSGTRSASLSIHTSAQCRILARSSTIAITSLFATSIKKKKISSSEIDDIQNELPSSVSNFRQLKDIMWIRETLEDLTTAEFALSLEQQSDGASSVNGNGDDGNQSSPAAPSSNSWKTKKRAVDYEKLMSQLTKRIEDMTCQSFVDYTPLMDDEGVLRLDENLGMGRYAYTNKERVMLMGRILKTSVNLSRVIERNDLENSDSDKNEESTFLSSFLEKVKVPEFADLRATSEDSVAGEGSSTTTGLGPKLYVRDDGTVDWEGALQDRAALRKFGGAVWARINGQTPDDLGEETADEVSSKGENENISGGVHETKPAVTAKIEDTPAIERARKKLVRLENELKEKEKTHTALVESGISAGQAVANVKLASVNPILRNEIRRSTEALQVLEQRVSHQNLVYELERIYAYLVTELENPTTKGYIPLQDRLDVAEYGLLESQVESCSRDLNSKGILDADIVAVIAEQMTDFKRRLGIDYYVAGLTYDREAITRWLNDLYSIAKVGIMFYVKGTRLLWNDVVYCFSLLVRAVQGATLKPRERLLLKRTVSDIVTFIPVVVILIVPITPVGHVLVFGAIQRFFPGFFPSCFTEQRQNLLQLYETTEFSEVTIKENLQERLNRFFEALAFSVSNNTRNAYKQLTNTDSEDTDDD